MIKKKKKHDKIVLLAKTKIDTIEVLISRVFIDSNISHDEFVSMNNLLREYDDVKEEIKNLKASTINIRFQSIHKTIISYCLKCRKNTESKNPRFAKTNKGKLMLLSNFMLCDSKKSRFIKEQGPCVFLADIGKAIIPTFIVINKD